MLILVAVSQRDFLAYIDRLYCGPIGQAFCDASWKKMVTDVADKIKIDWLAICPGDCKYDDLPVEKIEEAVVAKIFNESLQNLKRELLKRKLSEEELKKIKEKLGEDLGDPSIVNELFTGGTLSLAKLSGFGVYKLATTTLGITSKALGITLPFFIYTGLTKTISIILGPIGWGALIIHTIFKTSQPNFKKLTMAVVYIFYLRQKLQYES